MPKIFDFLGGNQGRKVGDRFSVLCVATVALIVSGCGGPILYSKANHDLAKKASTAVTDANLTDALKDERVLNETLLEREIEIVARNTKGRRDGHVLAIIGGRTKETSWVRLEVRIEDRLKKIVGDPNKVADFLTAGENLKNAKEHFLRFKNKYEEQKPGQDDPKLECPMGAYDKSKLSKLFLDVFIKESISPCNDVKDWENKLRAVPNNLKAIGGTEFSLLENDIEVLKTQRKDINELLNEKVVGLVEDYKQAKINYEQAVEAKAKAAAKTNIQTSLNNILDGISVNESGDSSPEEFENLQVIKKLELELESIENLINSAPNFLGLERMGEQVVDGMQRTLEKAKPTLSENLKGDLAVAELYVPLKDVIGKQFNYPNLSLLMMRAEQLRLQLDRAKRRLANTEKRLELLEEKRFAILSEASDLNIARNYAKGYLKESKCKNDKSMAEGFKTDTNDCKERTLLTLLHYANSWSVGRVQLDQIEVQLIGLQHSQVLDESEVALSQWENLIATPLSQLVTYHGGGFTSKDLADLISAAALVGISVGVN